jgi:5'-3' exonuclease
MNSKASKSSKKTRKLEPVTMIFDGNNLAHRARHKFNLSYQGLDTSVTYGTIRMIYAMLKSYDVQSALICWDDGYPARRKAVCPGYKSNRHHDQDDDYFNFLEQVRGLQEFLPNCGICSLRRPNCEADDLMFHATELISGKKIVVTSDHDMYQAITDDTIVYSHSKEIEVTRDNFMEVTEVAWDQWWDYQMLLGDSGDGVPGVPGIGHKTALKLLEAGYTAIGVTMAAQDGEKLPLSSRVVEALKEHGVEGCGSVLGAIKLLADIAGARQTVARTVRDDWRPFDRDEVERYFKSLMFISLLEPELYTIMNRLQRPVLRERPDLRWPVVSPPRVTMTQTESWDA